MICDGGVVGPAPLWLIRCKRLRRLGKTFRVDAS
jgi:hypothetical protein